MNRLKTVVTLFSIVIIVITGQFAFADTGPKPTLDIIVENPENSQYYLDLLGKEGEYSFFKATDGNEKYNDLHDQPIYKYDADGWKAIHMRTWLLFGSLTGTPQDTDSNGKVLSMKHSFSYHGVPNVFKIIIQKTDGSLLVSDVINNSHFNAVVHYDMKQNKVLSVSGNILKKGTEINSEFFLNYLMRMVLTLLVELLIAIPFFYKHLKRIPFIALINFITQTMLTIGTMFDYQILYTMPFNTGYFAVLLIGELIVFITEYLIYLKAFGKAEKRKIIVYTALANLLSFISGLLIVW